MRRTVLAAVIAAAAAAGCTNAPTAVPPAPPTTTIATPTTTPDPLATFAVHERAFIRAYTAAGFSNAGGNPSIVRLGELICQEIGDDARPASTQAALTGDSVTAPEAKQLYLLAHETMCPGYGLPDPNVFGEGTYEVGVDIAPGKYRSPGGDSCYWARLDANQETIDNDLSSGPTVFTVRDGDGYVELSRCEWTLTP